MAEGGQKRHPTMHRTPAQVKREIAKQQKPKEVKKRVKRNQARAIMEKAGRVRKGDNMEVDHRKPLRAGGSNSRGNLAVKSAKANRAHGSPAGGRATRGSRGR